MLELQTVGQLMNSSPITVFADTPLEEIKLIIQELKINSIVVVKLDPQGFYLPIGLIERDNLIQLKNHFLDNKFLVAANLVQKLEYSIKPQTRLFQVKQIMKQLGLNCIVVTGNNGELLGTISEDCITLNLKQFINTKFYNLILSSNRNFKKVIQGSLIVNSVFNFY